MRKYIRNFMPNATQKQYQASEAGVILKRNKNKPEFMKRYGISYVDISELFGYTNANSFYNASRRQDIMNGVEGIVQIIEEYNRKK